MSVKTKSFSCNMCGDCFSTEIEAHNHEFDCQCVNCVHVEDNGDCSHPMVQGIYKENWCLYFEECY